MKVIRCKDAGFDCNYVIRAKTENEAMKMAADHAKTVHGLTKINKATSEKIKSIMRDE